MLLHSGILTSKSQMCLTFLGFKGATTFCCRGPRSIKVNLFCHKINHCHCHFPSNDKRSQDMYIIELGIFNFWNFQWSNELLVVFFIAQSISVGHAKARVGEIIKWHFPFSTVFRGHDSHWPCVAFDTDGFRSP